MSAPARGLFPWLPEPGVVWHAPAGEYWDAVKVPRSVGQAAIDLLGGDCGPVICDPWPRVMFFLVAPRSTDGWDVPPTVPCSTATYVSVPSLDAADKVLHWTIPPTAERYTTPIGQLRQAMATAVAREFGPRTEQAS